MPEISEVIDLTFLIIKTLEKDGPQNITELAQKIATNRNKTTRYIQALEKRKIIQRTIEKGPPQQVIITLTPLGKCLARCLTQLQRPHETPGEQ